MEELGVRGLFITLVVGVAASLSCTAPELNPKKDAGAAQKGPPAKVDLPPIIKLEGTIPPETHPDGIMRVDGLIARNQKYLGQKIVVRGYLVQKSECPKDAKRCERPHAWLADTPAGGEKRLMVVSYDERVEEAIQTGEQYVVTGKFERKSDDGFVMSSGLLIYDNIEGLELPPEKDERKRRR